MLRIPLELAGDSQRTRREMRAEAKNSRNTANTHTHNKWIVVTLLTPAT